MEGFIFGGAYLGGGNLRFKIDWDSLIVGRKFTVFSSFYFVFEDNFQGQAPGGLIFGERFNGGFFCVTSLGAFLCKGLYMEGLIFGILRYFFISLRLIWRAGRKL